MADDYISRSEAIRVASGYCHWANIPKELERLPAADVRPVVRAGCDNFGSGDDLSTTFYSDYSCDHCGGTWTIYGYERNYDYDFCPRCGADFRPFLKDCCLREDLKDWEEDNDST